MKAKFVKENLDFERGQDPKEAMDIGIRSLEDHVKLQIKKNGIAGNFPDFLNYVQGILHQHDKSELIEEVLELIGRLPLKDQIKYLEQELELYIDEQL